MKVVCMISKKIKDIDLKFYTEASLFSPCSIDKGTLAMLSVVDFSVPKHFIEMGYRKLVSGGKMVMVTKRSKWYNKKLTAVFGGVKMIEKDGYYIWVAEKREDYVKKKKNHK